MGTIENVFQDSRVIKYRDRLYEFLSRERVMILLTVLPALLLFSFVNVIPIAWAVAGGFYHISAYHPEWTWAGLANYQRFLADEAFWISLRRSVVFAGGSVFLQLTGGIALAFLLDRSFKFNHLARAIAFLPYMIPTAIFGLIAIWMGNSSFGIVNQIFVDLGLINEYKAWFGDRDTAMLSIIFANSWKFAIFVTIMVLARLQSIPEDHYEAAKMAGATMWQQFRDITLPNLKGVIFIVLLLRGVWMFNKFDIVWVTTGGGPGDATRTAPIYVYQIGFGRANLGEAAAISTALFTLLVVSALLYFYVLEPSKEVKQR